MARRKISGCRVLLTGASSGIGRSLAIELARQGAKLVLVARRLEKLEEVAREIEAQGGDVVLCAGDVTDLSVRDATFVACQEHYGGLDVLINNAGVGGLGRFDEAKSDRLRRIMEVNFFAVAEWTRAALPLLRKGSRPMVVNMGSILGHRAIPHFSEYSASKFALRGLTESLRPELAPYGIDVLLVSPGSTDTDFYDNAIGGRKPLPWSSGSHVSSEHVARATIKAMRRGRREIVPSGQGRMLVWINRLCPSLVDRWMHKYGR